MIVEIIIAAFLIVSLIGFIWFTKHYLFAKRKIKESKIILKACDENYDPNNPDAYYYSLMERFHQKVDMADFLAFVFKVSVFIGLAILTWWVLKNIAIPDPNKLPIPVPVTNTTSGNTTIGIQTFGSLVKEAGLPSWIVWIVMLLPIWIFWKVIWRGSHSWGPI